MSLNARLAKCGVSAVNDADNLPYTRFIRGAMGMYSRHSPRGIMSLFRKRVIPSLAKHGMPAGKDYSDASSRSTR